MSFRNGMRWAGRLGGGGLAALGAGALANSGYRGLTADSPMIRESDVLSSGDLQSQLDESGDQQSWLSQVIPGAGVRRGLDSGQDTFDLDTNDKDTAALRDLLRKRRSGPFGGLLDDVFSSPTEGVTKGLGSVRDQLSQRQEGGLSLMQRWQFMDPSTRRMIMAAALGAGGVGAMKYFGGKKRGGQVRERGGYPQMMPQQPLNITMAPQYGALPYHG